MSFCANDIFFFQDVMVSNKVIILHLISGTSKENTIVLFDGSVIASSTHSQSLARAVNGSLDQFMFEVERECMWAFPHWSCGVWLVMN